MRQGLAMAVSYTGIAAVFGQELHFQGTQAVLGVGLVFASALLYSVYLVFSGELVQRIGALRLTGLASSISCFFCIGQLFVLRAPSAVLVPEPVLWLSLLNALVCTVAPILMVMMAIERIGAPLAAQATMVGPMSTVVLGVWLLGEPFTGWVIAGTLLVLTGVWLLTKWRN
jgi:drug/metabolite transporter (DMT)-like permease